MKKKETNNKGIFQFLTPEEQDNIIKTRVKMCPKRGGKVQRGWTEDALMVRRQVIIDLIGQGLSHFRIQQELMARWEISQTCAWNYIQDAIKFMGESNKEYYKEKTELMISRLEAIAEDALLNGDRKNALSAYDQLNKLCGLYVQKVDANVKDNVTISFDFGKE